MNNSPLLELCTIYGLGEPLSRATPVVGGLIHSMWRIETERGVYAVKELNAEIVTRPHVLKSLEVSESIAQKLKDKNIPAVTGISIKGKIIQNISGCYVIVYEWIEGEIVSINAASQEKSN